MGQEIKSFRDLVAWQKAFRLGIHVYELTKSFPADERFGLISQLRRGAVSVTSNIAEGYGRGSRTDYIRFLKVARGALYEIESQILFAAELGYLNSQGVEDIESQIAECSRILGGLIKSLQPKTP